MIKKFIFFVYFTFLFLFQTNLYASNKIAYLDFDVLLSEINKGKLLFETLNNLEDKKFREFNDKEEKFKEEEIKINGSRNLISENQLRENLNEFNQKINNYRNYKSKEIKKLKQKRKDEIFKLLDLINPIIQKYMTENSISMLFDKKNIYIADTNFDITNNLIVIINKSLNK